MKSVSTANRSDSTRCSVSSASNCALISSIRPTPRLVVPLDGSEIFAPAEADSTDNPLRAPAATGPREPAGPRAPSSLRAGWRRLVCWNDRLEDSWVGDLIGAVCLFATFYILIVIAGVLS